MALGNKSVILIVEDDPSVARTLAAVLVQAGYSAVVAGSREQAIELMSGVVADIALVDVHLPDSDGITLAREICKRVPDCKILLMTGNTEVSEWVKTAMEKGLEFEVFAKPIPPPELLERLSSLLPTRKESLIGSHRKRRVG
jgi:two-component system NtrC family response regulator